MPDAGRRKKKRSSERSKRHDQPAEDGEWQQFTSPDGHVYYYNAATKESRWELPHKAEEDVRAKSRRPKGSSKHIVLEQEPSLNEDEKYLNEAPKSKKERKRPESRKSVTEEAQATPKPKNAMFQKLQASLEGRLGAINAPMMGMGRPPPMLNIRREEEVYAGGAEQEETKGQTLEEQYEAETAGMSAAERLRFLRKKRQENMMAKRESITGDDFMAEVANNMKKKGVTPKLQENERKVNDKVLNWKEQEQVEEERKRQQMYAEVEAKEQETERKAREQQAAIEREQNREKERAEQLALEQRREEERIQRHDEESRHRQEIEAKKAMKKVRDDEPRGRNSEHDVDRNSKTDSSESDLLGRTSMSDSAVEVDDNSDTSSPERVNHTRRDSGRGSKHASSTRSMQQEPLSQPRRVEDDHPPAKKDQDAVPGLAEDGAQDEKHRAREERREQKQRQRELAALKLRESAASSSPRRKLISSYSGVKEESRTSSTSTIEAEEEARVREKQLRRERRRMAKMEATLAAQTLNENGDHQREQTQGMHANSSSVSGAGPSHTGGYPMNGQTLPGQPPFSGGIYPPPYPYPMMPPPPPSPYGYYYPYMQPPSMPMPMYPPSMVPPGYQLIPQTPPPSSEGVAVPSALVPYGADSMLASAYGYDMSFGGMYGQQSAPELSRCECCKGVGVGLVEKNGVCAHCNRLRLAFIVDSAQMRQRCSVCSGWGFQLLQANGMCEHCTRQTAQKAQRKISAARRRSSVATSVTAVVPVAAPPRRNSTGNPPKNDDIDWDKSSSDGSDWDD